VNKTVEPSPVKLSTVRVTSPTCAEVTNCVPLKYSSLKLSVLNLKSPTLGFPGRLLELPEELATA